MSKHPVGATWKGVEKETGKIACIWLERRNDLLGFEMWYWECVFPDGSRPAHWQDWNTSYRMCKDALPIDCRMKRIK
jgi:hypothetical protein